MGGPSAGGGGSGLMNIGTAMLKNKHPDKADQIDAAMRGEAYKEPARPAPPPTPITPLGNPNTSASGEPRTSGSGSRRTFGGGSTESAAVRLLGNVGR